jgi:hypothetical protein
VLVVTAVYLYTLKQSAETYYQKKAIHQKIMPK